MKRILEFKEWEYLTERNRQLERDLLRLTRRGICTFVYRRLDGRYRVLTGTRNLDLVPSRAQLKNPDRADMFQRNANGLFSIYEVDIDDWRRFYMQRVSRIISAEDEDGNRLSIG